MNSPNLAYHVNLGALKDRREPDYVNSKRFQVVYPRDDAFQVPDSRASGILERGRVDLIDRALFPPCMMLLNVTKVRLLHHRRRHKFGRRSPKQFCDTSVDMCSLAWYFDSGLVQIKVLEERGA
jgi:hypothetical protein